MSVTYTMQVRGILWCGQPSEYTYTIYTDVQVPTTPAQVKAIAGDFESVSSATLIETTTLTT